eukprot:6581127-Pyramimonas_sp.AAC.1
MFDIATNPLPIATNPHFYRGGFTSGGGGLASGVMRGCRVLCAQVLQGQQVMPTRTIESGYKHKYSTIDQAVRAILR